MALQFQEFDAVDGKNNKLLDRLTDASKPGCIEPIPRYTSPVGVLVSTIGEEFTVRRCN